MTATYKRKTLSELVAAWLKLRRQRRFTAADLEAYDALLSDVYYALPVPAGALETWAVRSLLEWIYRERSLVAVAQGAGVGLFGTLRR
ncbi:MAG TPA: hypothetical protein PKD23_06825 [Bellilinea sp.]|nr:hypothetical protein [Bellilinea sp.]